MSLTFLEPGWLVLLFALPALWFWPRRLRGKEAAQTGVLRALALGLIVIALAKPASIVDDDRSYHVLVVDDSSSMPDVAKASAAQIETDRRAHATPGELQHYLHFGTELSSPIGDALGRAARSIPTGYPGEITLITDGQATDTRWASAVAELTSRGIPVHTLLVASSDSDPRIVAVTGAPQSGAALRVGTTVAIEARILDAPAAFDLVLEGQSGGEIRELARESFVRNIQATEITTAQLSFEPESSGFLTIAVRIESTTPLGREENDTFATTLAIGPPLEALYVGSRMARGGEALSELVGPGFHITNTNPDDLSDPKLAEVLFGNSDLVVLDDAPASTVSNASLEAIAAAVTEAGLGLFASGGSGAFGPGGWHKTPIEELLPVEFVQKEEKRDPSTTLVIIIDTSDSMGGNRVQLAKEVSRLAIRRLLPHDKVGLVEFYGAKRWAVPIQPASNAIEIERALNRLNAGGGTVILPAIEEAFYGLKNVRTRYKHVLILTDGGVETGAFEPLLRSMAEDGINVSTVLIGSAAHSEFLVTLANWGKGRFYGVPNRFNLPEILLKQPTTAKLPSMRPGPHVVSGRGGATWWGDVDPAELPELGAYVETSLKDGAHKVIETANEGHPVLASWNNGLGRVTTLMTEPTGPASEGWQGWDGYGPLMARALEQTARDRMPFRFEILRDDWRVRLIARSRFADSGAAFPGARIFGADSGDQDSSVESPIQFRRLAPGWFEADFFCDPADELRLHVGDASSQNGLKGLAVSRAFDDVAGEFAIDPADALDLSRLSSVTGGQHGILGDVAGNGIGLTGPSLPATGGGDLPKRRRALWPLALAFALAVYLTELLNRRLVGGIWNSGRAGAAGI